MKMIDQKGKLLSKISIIDILIIGILCFGGFFFIDMFKEEVIVEAAKDEVIFVFEAKNTTPSFYESIEIGTKVYNSSRNYYVGEVIDVKQEPLKVWTEDIINGEFKVIEDPNRYTVHITIKSEGTNSDTAIYAGQELIKVGHIFPIKGKGFASNGVVIGIEEVGHE